MSQPGAPSATHVEPSRGAVWAAGAVHAYTMLGSVLALLMIHLAYQGEVEAVLWLFLVSMVIDGTDGFLARHFDVKNVMPGFDGALLDNVVDYLTYAVAPMALLWATGYLPAGAWGGIVASVPLLASCVQFCRTDAKPTVGGEHYFLGFPSYWNIVAFYIVAMDLGGATTIVVLLACTALVFVPITYVYPSRTETLWQVTFVLTALWFGSYALILSQLPDPAWPVLAASLLYVVYYVALSLWLTLRQSRSGAPARA